MPARRSTVESLVYLYYSVICVWEDIRVRVCDAVQPPKWKISFILNTGNSFADRGEPPRNVTWLFCHWMLA